MSCAERQILVGIFFEAIFCMWGMMRCLDAETTESKLEMESQVLASDVWFGGEKMKWKNVEATNEW